MAWHSRWAWRLVGASAGVLVSLLALGALGLLAARWCNGGYVGPQGIDRSEWIELGGIPQYVRLRGRDPGAPILLFLHGGPGFPMTFLGHRFEPALVDDFVVVHWEQRGAGRSWYRNQQLDSSTITLAEIRSDLAELIAAYVGTGQVVDFDEGKVFAATSALERLPADAPERQPLQQALSDFQASRQARELDPQQLEALILASLDALPRGRQLGGLHQLWLGLSSPDMGVQDARWFLTASDTAAILARERTLLQTMYFDHDARQGARRLQVPVCFIQGEHDWITPTPMVESFAASLEPAAPVEIIAGAGHTPFLDDPDAFARVLRRCLDR